MSVNLAPGPFGLGGQFFSGNTPLNAGLIYTYAAGTTTPLATFTTNSILTPVPNANPIVLNANGILPQEVWLTAGFAYKFVVTDSVGNVIFPYTMDNVTGINDFSSIPTGSEWILTGLTPTFVSTTSFTLTGDQTANFKPLRRVKIAETAGTVYGVVISSSVTASVTTVTVSLDAGAVVDNGISTVSYGLLNSINPSIPQYLVAGGGISVIYSNGVPTISATQLQSISASISANSLTANYLGGSLDFRSSTLSTGTPTSLIIPSISLTVASGATLGTIANIPNRLWLAVINNAGTPELAIINTQVGGGQIAAVNESALISTTALSGTANTAGIWYSTTARTSVAFRLVGYIETTEVTPGTWLSPNVIEGMGQGIRKPGDLIQEVVFETGAVATGTGTFTQNDVIPINTNGDQYMSLAIVPTGSPNFIDIETQVLMTCSASNQDLAAAIFQDAIVNALASIAIDNFGSGDPTLFTMKKRIQALSTSSTTLKIRAGTLAGGTNTFNGSGGTRVFGGSMNSYLRLKEYMA